MITDTIREHCPEATWLVHSSGSQTFVLAAIATGVHTRVGFEDSPFPPHNLEPRSNADYVDWAVTQARRHGREPATPAQARDLLGLLPPVAEAMSA